MAPVAALLDTGTALAALKRNLPNNTSLRSCRSASALFRYVGTTPVDGIVVGTRAARRIDLPLLRQRFPAVPLFVYGFVRPDEADFVIQLYDRFGAAGFLVEGVDDAAAIEVIGRATISARRRAEMASLPRMLRLTERLQLDAFAALENQTGGRASTALLASKLTVSREHLSRQFGAGGAPNLKRVVDFFQVIVARDLLQNPGYPAAAVAKMVGYSTPSHLQSVSRRVVGLAVRDLPRTPNADLIRRFVAIGARSRH